MYVMAINLERIVKKENCDDLYNDKIHIAVLITVYFEVLINVKCNVMFLPKVAHRQRCAAGV